VWSESNFAELRKAGNAGTPEHRELEEADVFIRQILDDDARVELLATDLRPAKEDSRHIVLVLAKPTIVAVGTEQVLPEALLTSLLL